MAYKYYRFEIKEDQNGETGFVPASHNGSTLAEAASSPTLMIHDILEHNFLNDNGESRFEWQAMGFYLWGRVQGNYVNNFINSSLNIDYMESIALSFNSIHQFQMMNMDKTELIECNTTFTAREQKELDYMDDEFKQIYREITTVIQNYFEYQDESFSEWYDISIEEYAKRAVDWIRTGYIKAVKKYEWKYSFTPFAFCNMWHKLQEKLDVICSELSHNGFELYEGYYTSVGVDLKSGKTKVIVPKYF